MITLPIACSLIMEEYYVPRVNTVDDFNTWMRDTIVPVCNARKNTGEYCKVIVPPGMRKKMITVMRRWLKANGIIWNIESVLKVKEEDKEYEQRTIEDYNE